MNMKKLLSMFLALSLSIGLTGCGGKEPKPQETVTAMIEAYKAQKLDEVDTYYDNEQGFFEESDELNKELESAEEELMKTFINKLTDVDYTIDEEKVDGDNATVTVTITANNIGEKMTAGFQQAVVTALGLAFSDKSEEEVQKIVTETMITPVKDCEKNYKNTVNVTLIKSEEGKWLITSEGNDDLANALTGGLIEFSKELQNMSSENAE